MNQDLWIVLSGVGLFLVAGFFGIFGIFQMLKQKVKAGVVLFSIGSFLVLVYIIVLLIYFNG